MKFSLTSGEYPVSRIEVGQTANVLDIVDVVTEVAGRVIIVLHLLCCTRLQITAVLLVLLHSNFFYCVQHGK